MRATVKDVARRAGVSPKTVSNVMNGIVPVSGPTRLRVEQAMAELDYVPNLSARGLRNGRSGVIALALPDLATPYSAEVAHHIVEVAHEQGWIVQIEETGSDPQREQELMTRARSNLIDGLILNPVVLDESAVKVGVTLPPVVLLGEVTQQLADRVFCGQPLGGPGHDARARQNRAQADRCPGNHPRAGLCGGHPTHARV